jgi:uncharacterized phage-associated protein
MYHPLQIANYFINKSFQTGVLLTPMKLLKLVYLAHGWNLGIRGQNLITEAAEAWKYGPVIRSVYDMFKKYGTAEITSMANSYAHSNIDEDSKKLLDKVWDVHKDYNGLQLSTITHEPGSPWDLAWNRDGGNSTPCKIIPNDSIKDYYLSKSNQNKAKNNA